MNDLHAFLNPFCSGSSPDGSTVNPLQIGQRMNGKSWEAAEIVLLGCGDTDQEGRSGADAVREELYGMYDWHPAVSVADIGNIRPGATRADTQAALRIVLEEIYREGKIAVIIGGTQDLTLQQYAVFERAGRTIEAAVLDSLIDLDETEETDDKSFLMDMLTRQPNFIRHFSHMGFQSYYTNPRVLETLDKLRFDCFRLGRLQEAPEEMEPVLRTCHFLSVDMHVLRRSEAPFLPGASPNGLFGNELCQMMRYAGMGTNLSSLGIYGYNAENDQNRQGAKLIAQMLWYFIDGHLVRKNEASLENQNDFIAYHVALTDNDTLFLKSKKTNRWWMQLPDQSFTPCSYNDYLSAGNHEIPERWLRAQERMA